MNFDANEAVPAMTLTGASTGSRPRGLPVPDLLATAPTDTNFVVEVESDGTAHLRFGDDINGMRPASGTAFTATYRIGNGTAGNVGAESLIFLAADDAAHPVAAPIRCRRPAASIRRPTTRSAAARRRPF